jgi:hypothetical protein
MIDKPFEAHKFRALWQSMPTDIIVISAEEMRLRAVKFEKRVRSRNLREYIACGFVVVVFCWYATFSSTTILWPIANLIIVLATIYVGFSLHQKGKAAKTPAGGSVPSLIDFHREALVRQRDALKTVWRWYLLPFAPGLVLWFAAMWIGHGGEAPRPAAFATALVMTFVFGAMVFVAILLLNLLGAARLQRMIEDLDRYKEKT